MDVRMYIIISFALWLLVGAVVVSSVSVYVPLVLIGILVVLAIGDFYLPDSTKEALRYSAYMMLIVFAFIVAKKVWEIVK
jgi:hypothetical protein